MAAKIIVSAIAVLWLGATLASQWRNGRIARWIKTRDAFAVVPLWTFFAPNPGTHDTRVLWRDRLVDGTLTPWHEVIPPDTGGFRRAFWNPRKRERKAVFDAGQLLALAASKSGDNPLLLLTLPFVTLLAAVSALPASPLSQARQFVVVHTAEGDPVKGPALAVASKWHALSPAHDSIAERGDGQPLVLARMQ